MRREFWWYLLLFIPGFIAYFTFVIGPIGISIYYSFFDWDGINPDYNFVGFQNFVKALSDSQFGHSIYVTFFITIIGTLVVNVLGILFAVLLNKNSKLNNFYRAVFFFPLLLSTVVIGFLWKAILYYDGIFNDFFGTTIEFFGSADNALFTITSIAIWQSVGGVIVLYLAGLKGIPTELYEAGKIDGASRWQEFKSITFPLLAPAMTMSIIFMFTSLAREYDRIAVLTFGGPGGATETIAYYIVRLGFNANQFSYAASLAVIMLLIIGGISVLIVYVLKKREERMS